MCSYDDCEYNGLDYDPDAVDEVDTDDDEGNVKLSWEVRRFIKALMDLDQYALTHASAFYRPVEQAPPVAKPSYVVHTLWTCQEVGGFFHYTVTHDLGAIDLDVTLDSNESFSYKIVDKNAISIMAPEKLWGVDVTVKRKGL